MAALANVMLYQFHQSYTALYAAGLGLVWFLVRLARHRYFFPAMGEDRRFGPTVADGLILAALAGLVQFLFRLDSDSIAVALWPGVLYSYGVEVILHRRLMRANGKRRILVVGEAIAAQHVVNRLEDATGCTYRAIGVLPMGDAMHDFRAPVLGRLPKNPAPGHGGDVGQIHRIAESVGADLILLVQGGALMGPRLRRITWGLQLYKFPLAAITPPEDIAAWRLLMRPMAGLFIFHILPSSGRFKRLLKACMDRILALFLSVLLAPPMLIIGLAVRLDSRGPMIYPQVRVGQYGKQFVMCKFRTMHVDADRRSLADSDNETDGLLFKMRRDPRLTRMGSFLRRSSLDELPQLFNVLRGDMSLVGPRPPLPEEIDMYDPQVKRRLLVKPGLTGLWQVSGRSDLPWDEAMNLDLNYVDNWSLAGDFHILIRTFSAVIRAGGAY
ncbi:sugar transferase [Streptomyces sp. NPDC002758]